MAAVLPVANQNGGGNLLRTLQEQVDESIVRENETLETLETQTSVLKEMVEGVNTLVDPLRQIVSLLTESAEDRERLERQRGEESERRAVTADIAGERGDVEDVSATVRDREPLFDFSNIDTSFLSNTIGAAFMAWVFDLDEVIRSFATTFTKTFHRIVRGIFNFPIKVFRGVASFIRSLDVLGPIRSVLAGPLEMFVKAMSGIGSFMSSAAQSLGKVGRILRMFLGPFTLIIFGIIDFVKGFVQGFRDGGVMEGLKSGLGELLAGLVGIPLDMVKSLTAWVAEKFGWDNVSKALEGFSFRDLIRDTFGKMWDRVKSMFDVSFEGLRKMIFGDDDDETPVRERGREETLDPRERHAQEAQEERGRNVGFGLLDPEVRRTIEDVTHRRIETREGLTDTGAVVGRESEASAQEKDQAARERAATAVIDAKTTTNSNVNVQNNRGEFMSPMGPRSSDHTYRRYQRSAVD